MVNIQKLNNEISSANSIWSKQNRREVKKAYQEKIKYLEQARDEILRNQYDLSDFELDEIINRSNKLRTQTYVGLREGAKLQKFNASRDLVNRAAEVKQTLPQMKVSEKEARARGKQPLKQVQQQGIKQLNQYNKFVSDFNRKIESGGKISNRDLNTAKKFGISQRVLVNARSNQIKLNKARLDNINYYSQFQSKIPNKDLFNLQNQKKIGEIRETPKNKRFFKNIEQVEQEGIIAGQKGGFKGRAVEFIKRGSADFIGSIKGTYNFAKDLNHAIYKRGKEQQEAQKRVKKVFSLATLSQIGASIGSDLQSSNPYEKTRGMLAILPIVGVPLKLKQSKIANAVTQFDTKANPFKGSIKTTTTTKGILETGKDFTQKATFRYEPKSKTLYGNTKVTIDGKTKTENFVFKDKGGFYEDKNGRKIPKSYLPVKNARVNIKETSIIDKKIDKPRTYEGQVIITGQKIGGIKKTTQYLDLEKKRKTTIIKSKQFELDYAKNWFEKGEKVKQVMSLKSIFINPTTKLSKINLKNRYTTQQLENFLKSVNYDKTIVNGLDKRNRLAIALGLPERSKKLTKIKKLLDEYFKFESKGLKTELKGLIRAKGELIEINKVKFRLSSLTSPIFEDLIKINKKSKKGKIEVPKQFSIPKIEITIKKIRKLRIPLKLKSKIIDKLKKELNAKKQEQKKKSKQKVPQKIKIPTKIKISKQKKKNLQIQKKIIVSKNKNLQQLQKQKPLKTKISKLPKLPVKEKLKIPKLLKFKDKLPKGYTYVYDGKIRVKGKIKTIKLGLPTNRALNKVGKLIDNTTARSMQLVPIGIIKKAKDISKPSVASKFRVRKGKKALLLVEKSKYAIDTTGEKMSLSIGKLLSPNKKSKKVVKKKIIKKSSMKIKKKMNKTIKRVKKSSKKTYKGLKSSKTRYNKKKR